MSAGQTSLLLKLSVRPAGLYKKSAAPVKQTGLAQIDEILKAVRLTSIEPIFHPVNDDRIDGWVQLRFASVRDMERALDSLDGLDQVEAVQPNGVFRLDYIPDDPEIDGQWALERIGAFAAWDIERGSKDVLIAVIDTGIDYDHPDLAANLWINPGEDLNGNGRFDEEDVNFIDDDDNGFVDDIRGWDFTDAPNYPDGADYLDRDNDPFDEMGHGTQIAGIISAIADNGLGVAGVAHGCRVMNIRFSTARGYGEEDDAASSILYAMENGARIVNMSWGDTEISRIMDDIFHYAADKGVVLVASAGNSATDQIHYPSGFNGTISVGAVQNDETLASFSNYGPSVDLMAPGVSILTTALHGDYTTVGGTSFSAPFVSAAAGLLLSRDSTLSADVVRSILVASTDDLGEPGWDARFSAGRLNVEKMLSRPLYAVADIARPLLDEGFSADRIEVSGSAWSPIQDYYSVEYGEGDNPVEWFAVGPPQKRRLLDDVLATWEDLPSKDGSYTLRLSLFNLDGSILYDHVRIFIDRTAPVISSVVTQPMVDGDGFSVLIEFHTDDLCEGSVFYRPRGSNGPFAEAVLPFRTQALRFNLGQEEVSGDLEFYVQARNGAGLVTDDDNSGLYYRADLSAAPIDVTRFTADDLTLPFGTLLSETADFDGDGVPELVNAPNLDDGVGPITLFEFNGFSMEPVFATDKRLIPRDLGDADNDGKTELLCGLGFSSYLYESPQEGRFPDLRVTTWEGDGSTQYWASRIADLDGDGLGEVILRVVRPGEDGSDEFEVWERSGDNTFSAVASFPNPTGGENLNGVPFCRVGDPDNDGWQEILIGDGDGDLYIYENTSDNSYTATWSDSLPLLDSIDYLGMGDFDGDGVDEFIAGCHSDPGINTEHEYDARHWVYRLYDGIGDNRYVSVGQWSFFGFEPPKDFKSGVSSADVDGDGREEIFVCVFPDLYIIDCSKSGHYDIIYHHSMVQSNTVIVTDADNDGLTEFWAGTGEETASFEPVGADEALPAPVGVSARPLDESHVLLEWREIAEADEYRIYRGSDTSLLYYATSVHSPFIDTQVQSGQEYQYALISAKSGGSLTSRLSRTVRARPGARPWVTGAKMETETSVRVYFSEPMNERIKDATNYSIDGQVGRPVSVAHDASGEEAVLMLLRPFVHSGQYRVTCRDLADLDDTPLDTLRDSADFEVIFAPKSPYLVEGQLVSANRIELVFSEDMDSSVENSDNYDLGENMDVVAAVRPAGAYDRVQLTVESKSPIGALGLSYPIRVKNLKSAAGVAMTPGRGTFLELIFARGNLHEVFTYPNPCLTGLGDQKVTFANLTREAEIRILTSYGLPVRTLLEDDGDGGVDWDLRNESGQIVASGIYIYRVTCKDQSVMGKLAIVR